MSTVKRLIGGRSSNFKGLGRFFCSGVFRQISDVYRTCAFYCHTMCIYMCVYNKY